MEATAGRGAWLSGRGGSASWLLELPEVGFGGARRLRGSDRGWG